jgi:hypothetical protein
MTWFLTLAGLTAVLAAGMALIAGQLMPRAQPIIVGLTVLLAQLAIIAAIVIYFVAGIGPPGPDEIDAGAMAMVAFTMLGAMAGFMCLVVGWPVATIVASAMRRKQRP